jgi:menaquinone-9 beta-reductase
MSRQWAGLTTNKSAPKLLGAGQLFEKMTTSEDMFTFLINPELRRVAILLPVGRGLVRAYLMYGASQIDRLQRARDVARLMNECVKTGIPAQCYAAARPIGPLASFDLTETWVDHPYQDGIVLMVTPPVPAIRPGSGIKPHDPRCARTFRKPDRQRRLGSRSSSIRGGT